VIREGINVAHKLVRQRARPKILLCSDYEDAAAQAMEYRNNLLAVVSDVQFPRAGAANENAGFELAHMIREAVPDVPIVLHSSHTEYRARANAEGFAFLQKRSPTFLRDFRACSRSSAPSAILSSACPMALRWRGPATSILWKNS
jgi:DNA-binding NarL/FixJ family response regulator